MYAFVDEFIIIDINFSIKESRFFDLLKLFLAISLYLSLQDLHIFDKK